MKSLVALTPFLLSVCLSAEAGGFVYPVGEPTKKPTHKPDNANGYLITEDFADESGHTGVDLGNNAEGGQIRSIGPGQVSLYIKESDSKGFGNVVVIRHNLTDGTYYSLYAHMKNDSVLVNKDDTVQAGTPIGEVDCSGTTKGVTPCENGRYGPHLHFAVKKVNSLGCGYITSKCTSGDSLENYVDPLNFVQNHLEDSTENTKDIWTTSVYSYATCSGPFPGGGANDEKLRVGGWGDEYYSLIQLDLRGQPAQANSATLYLYCFNQSGGGTPMYLDVVTGPWDWTTTGTGCDHLRLWWADRPPATQWIPGQIPNATASQWYSVNITDLYNAWKSGMPNYGVQLRPVNHFANNFNEFYSLDYTGNLLLRPKLVVDP